MSNKQIIFKILIIILVIEALIMQTMSLLPIDLSILEETVLDASSLAVLSTPFIYFLVIKPFKSEADKAMAKVSFLSYHDELTNLPNRSKFLELLDYSINTSLDGTNISIVLVELGRLKTINDTFGHRAVQSIIVEVSKRLKNITGNTALLSKIDADKFVILIEHDESDDAIYSFSKSILNTTMQSITYLNHTINLDAYIGISNFPKDTLNKEDLLKFAGVALGKAKKNEEDKISFYTKSLTDIVHKNFMLEADLRHAVERNEFFLLYQPKIDIAQDKLMGAEALIRWQHPKHGLINPIDFIPLAEETGLILEIGEWVLNEVLTQQNRWISEGKKPIVISINLSAKQLRPEQIVQIIQTLNMTTVSMRYIEFEITETCIMDNPAQSQTLLELLHKQGVSLAMDDFGTGHSSFAYLKRFRVNVLKIDRMLIKDIENNQNDFTISKAIVVMAHALGMKVVAEGVETQKQVEMLKDIGCDYIQGFYYSKPVNANSVYSANNYTI